MDTEKTISKYKFIARIALALGIVLLGIGIVLELTDSYILPNNKAVVGISFIPITIAFTNYTKIRAIKKYPQKMRNVLISENDERVISQKNEFDAMAFKIVQAALFLSYLGYTFMVPNDIFEAVGWWIILGILFLSFIAQGVITIIQNRNENSKDDE